MDEDIVQKDRTDTHVKVTIKNASTIYDQDFDGADLINQINANFTREEGGCSDDPEKE